MALLAAMPISAGTQQESVLRIASLLPRTLNPLLAEGTIENAIDAISFDLLVDVDAHGKPVPRLAERVPTLRNGDISKDGLSITYHLRHNVKWHDGVPFTSKDVAFSWSAIMNPKNNVISRRGYDLVSRVDTPDPYTAIFRLKHRFAPAVLTFFSESDEPYRIVPEHILGNLADINEAGFNQHPVGTGPFKFVRWDRGNEIVYVANPDYYLGRPRIDRVIVKEIPDLNTQVIQLRTHAADFMVVDSSSYEALAHAPGIVETATQLNAYTSLMLNVQSPALRDVRVRRAMAIAIDKKTLAKKLTHPTFEVATGDQPPFLWSYDPNVRRYPYDPATARRILAPLHLSVELLEQSGSISTRQLDVQLQAMLQSAGMRVTIKPMAPQLVLAPAALGGPVRAGKYDMMVFGWLSGADPDDSSQFLCGMMPPNGNNFSRYCDAAVDRAERLAVSSYDVGVRKRAYAVIQRRLADDLPMIFLYWPTYRLAFTSALHGVDDNGFTETWNLGEWYLSR